MVNRLVSADENHNVPDNLNIRDVNLPDRLQDTALNATYVPKWKPNTAYALGEPVLNPSGDTVTAKAAFTSGATFDAANWNLSATYAAKSVETDKLDKSEAASTYSKKTNFNVKDFGALGNDSADDIVALEAARDAALAVGGRMVFPPGNYRVSRTFYVGDLGAMKTPISLVADASPGSLFSTIAPVLIKRTNAADTFPIMVAAGYGLQMDGIGFDGRYGVGTLLDVRHGFELRLNNVRFYRSAGAALTARALSNARLENVHVDNSGSTTIPAVTFGKNAAGISNSTYVKNMHIERSPGVDLDIAGIDPVNDYVEFIWFEGLHVEGTIDNSTISARKTTAHVLVGNAKNVVINSSFIYGGTGPLVVVDKGAGATSFDDTLTLSGTHLFGHTSAGAQPAQAVDLVSGNGVTIDNCAFDDVTTDYIRVASGFGEKVKIGTTNKFNHSRTSPISTAAVSDFTDARSTSEANTLYGGHLAISGKLPPVTMRPGSGTTPPAAYNEGTDNGGKIVWGTGTAPTAGAAVVRVTFKKPFAAEPYPVVSAANAATAALAPYVGAVTTTYFEIICNVAPAASQPSSTYQFKYVVIGP